MSNKPIKRKIAKNITVVMPPGAEGISDDDSPLDSAMRLIALAIDPEDRGWSSKYGADYENEIFMMHRYCWCDEEKCPWCGMMNMPNFMHKKSGLRVWWYKYIGRDMEMSPKSISGKKMALIVKECLDSIDARPNKGDSTKEGK